MNRSRVAIVAAILSAAQEPIKITPLMYSAGMNHAQIFFYVRQLIELGLTETVGNDKFVITEKGRIYLENYRIISESIA